MKYVKFTLAVLNFWMTEAVDFTELVSVTYFYIVLCLHYFSFFSIISF